MFGLDFIATSVVCDLAHFMHELLGLLLADHHCRFRMVDIRLFHPSFVFCSEK